MADVKTAPKKAAGNKTTELIIGAAANKLATGLTALTAAVAEAQKIEVVINDGTLQVTNLEDQIGSLKQQLVNDKAQNKLELELDYNTNKEAFANQYLQSKQMIGVSSSDWQNVNSELVETKANIDKTVQNEVAKASAILNNTHAQALKIKELEYSTKEAENIANMKQLQNEVTFLKGQVTSWEKALDAERAAGIERAKAGAVGTINVGQR